MADRMFHSSVRALELEIVNLYAKFTVGQAGAPTLDSTASKGIASVARDSAGQYTLTLSDKYNSLLWADVKLVDTADSSPATVGVENRLEVIDQVGAASPHIQFQFYASDDGAATDPAEDAVVLVKLELKNTTL